MLQWVVIVFTALPPNVPPKVQYIPVPSKERCLETIELVTPKFEAAAEEYGLTYRLECRKIKLLPKEEEEAETEAKEDATVSE